MQRKKAMSIPYTSGHNPAQGYTLLEMAIVMLVMGMLLVAFANAYNIYLKNKVQRITVENTNQVVNAIGHYLVQNGHYPCPARLDAGRDDADYGMAGDCEDTATVAVGTCANGICVEEGDRTVNINPNPMGSTMVTPRVRRGAVPFRMLSLPEDTAEDGYKQKILYAVTENLAVPDTYRKDAGGISILDNNDETAIVPASSAHFVVFSAGEDGRGAYTRYGQLKLACADPADAKDAVNCHTGNTGNDDKARYRVSNKATTDTNTHYDDHVKYYSSNETPLWRVANDDGDITDLIEAGSGGRIGVQNDSPTRPLHVQGVIQMTDNLEALDLCNTNPANDDCFDPNLIGGDEERMECPENQVLSYIADGEVHCVPYATGAPMPCPDDEYMTGLDSNGEPICVGVAGCPQVTMNMCQIDGTYEVAIIPPGLQGDTFNTEISGISFRRHLRCNGSDWVGRSPATSGICSCTPVEESNNVSCHSWGVMPGSGSNGEAGATRCTYSQCWTGTATRPFSRTCPDGVETTGAVDNSGCSCIEPYTRSRTRTCSQLGHPSGWDFEGSAPRQETTWTCTGAQSGVWSGWTLVDGTDTCACVEDTDTRHLSCRQYYDSLGQEGEGYTGGGVDQVRQTTCPGPTIGPWVNSSPVDCTCNSSYYVPVTDLTCTPPEVGVITARRYMDCTTGELGPVEIISELCSEPLYRWTQNGQQIPGGGALPHKLGVECPTLDQASTCSIPQGSDYAHFPCRCQ